MRALVLSILMLLCSPLTAAPIDSSASGVYLGSDRVCRVVLWRYSAAPDGILLPWWVQVDLRCIQFDGTWTVSLSTVYAPNNCPQGIAYILNPWPPGAIRQYLNLRTYDAQDQTLQVVRGTDQNGVANGIGTAEAWYRIGIAESPTPYSCPALRNKG